MVKVSVNKKTLNDFIEGCRRFAAQTKIAMRDSVLEQAMLACQDAAKFTPPMPSGGGKGLSPGARKAGLNAVAGDISKIFVAANDQSSKVAPSRIINQIAFAVKSDDFGAFNRIVNGDKIGGMFSQKSILSKIVADTDRQRAFAKAKNFLNRANPIKTEYGTQGFVTNLRPIHDKVKSRFGGRLKRGQKAVTAKLLVDDKSTLAEYIKQRQKAVGMVKSGWVSAMRSLPTPTNMNGQQGLPGAELRNASWVTMHNSVPGTSASTFTEQICRVLIQNPIGNINGIADEADTLGFVYENRLKQMKAMAKYRMQKAVDAFKNT